MAVIIGRAIRCGYAFSATTGTRMPWSTISGSTADHIGLRTRADPLTRARTVADAINIAVGETTDHFVLRSTAPNRHSPGAIADFAIAADRPARQPGPLQGLAAITLNPRNGMAEW